MNVCLDQAATQSQRIDIGNRRNEYSLKERNPEKLAEKIESDRHWMENAEEISLQVPLYKGSQKKIKVACKFFPEKSKDRCSALIDCNDTVFIVPGKGEASIFYAELIRYLNELGLNVYIIDHPGQGFSDRFDRNGKIEYENVEIKYYQQCDCIDFDTNADALLSALYAINQRLKPGKKMTVLAHSMGCLVYQDLFMRASENDKKMLSERINAALFVSPLVTPDTGFLHFDIARNICNMFSAIGLGRIPAPVVSKLFRKGKPIDRVTNDEYSKKHHSIFETLFPYLATGAATNRFAAQLMNKCREILWYGDWGIPGCRFLVLEAENDKVVKNKGYNFHWRSISGNCGVKIVRGALHAILFEERKYSQQVVNSLLSLIFNDPTLLEEENEYTEASLEASNTYRVPGKEVIRKYLRLW
jgi:alpha-beta hydrolase superfamily lysophospholipase